MYKSQENPEQQLSGENLLSVRTKCVFTGFYPQMFQMEQRINSRYDVGSDNGVINVSQELLPRGVTFKEFMMTLKFH